MIYFLVVVLGKSTKLRDVKMDYNKKNTNRRPMEVSEKHFSSEWDRIFSQKNTKSKDKSKENK